MDWSGHKRIAVLTGAGISTDSGIPDYRGPDGVWTRNPGEMNTFTLDTFLRDAETRQRFWSTYVDHAAWHAQPNDAHRALAGLAESDRAVRVLTQNIDGLHQKAGLPARKVLELHGSMHSTGCVECRRTGPTAPVLDRVRAGETDPKCPDCGGILKLGVILFGEYLDSDVLARAEKVAEASEVFLAVGTSLQVEPVASLCAVAVTAGARLVIVNRDPTPYDDYATAVIRDPIGVAVPEICAALAE
ncbi:SIR2 family NAD-dependent protein deacylase [Actinocrispum wychmicini]|uniref:protein acetyllysine N-acetyltransferase n=1 Tax=Actinocrispum wychmicini TaxID=1213861 RepID=A0A4R2IXR6_9PSEU|nr:Sir2 family NAD-dependent protein deacetylase [Actinocrispum wychmicini]TCO49732.1 NAD-dependent deacetylase [Actinocrispum wychmicini]